MKNKLRFVFLFCFLHYAFILRSQSILSGVVTNDSAEILIGVTVSSGKIGTVTNENGMYQLQLSSGSNEITFSYVGFESQIKSISVSGNENVSLNIQLQVNPNELNVVVVTASRYEKNITEETVSMEVLKPAFITNVNAIDMNDVLKQVPGVTMIDDQANIRGGSGFSYGAGSRVLMMVDDIPQLTADANDVKWEFIPMENLNQVEVIKGASSVLYGSSALNGVVNARTNYPTSIPKTQINFYDGYFLNPKREEIIWWGNLQPNFAGGNFMHSRKFGQFDLVLGGNLYNENSFREGEYSQRGRINSNMRYRFKNIEGLSIGLNTNYMYYHSGTYFLWADDTTGAYRPLGGLDSATTTISEGKNTRLSVDPFVNYFSKNGDHHSFKSRYFYTRNNNNTNQGSTSKLFYGEYQYQKQFHFGLNLIAGATANYSNVVAELYDNHTANNFALFTQLDKKFGKLSIVAGLRYETFRVDTFKGTSQPVLRAGINYPLSKSTFLRASYGGGYRFPSIAEKYISTSISLLKIFPNPDVQPESGWTAEVGIKHAFKIGNWLGYVDVAAFMQRYHDLIEFSFGYYDPNPIPGFININYLGFKSINIDNARISGAELSVMGQGNIGKVKTSLLGGITLISPINIDQKYFVDSVIENTDGLSQEVIDSLNQTKILNYRFEVTAKLSLDVAYKKFSGGLNFQYNSFMKNIDPFFLGTDPLLIYIYGKPTEFIPGVAEYRAIHDHGDFTFDLRLSYDLTKTVRFSFITKNIFNREYMVRPALLEAPRSVQAEVSVRF